MDAERQELLEQAARAYMNAEYDEAVELWQQVLESEPDNTRAREGLKKVEMLRSSELADDTPSSPLLQEVELLLDNRRFDEAVRICRDNAAQASPSAASELRRLQQRAERARAVEPQIQRAVHAARTALRDGRAKEALPYLKQVLSLDRDHPVATRLMQAIRDRARARRPSPPTAPTQPAAAPASSVAAPEEILDGPDESAPDVQADTGPLPASGQPGSDAPDMELELELEEPPAPAGMGLPSSAPAGDDALPELELESIELENEGPALNPVSPADDSPDEGGDRGESAEPGAPGGMRAESPFAMDGDDAAHDAARPSAGSASVRSTNDGKPANTDESMPTLSELPGVASPDLDEDRPDRSVPASRRAGHALRTLLLLAASLTVVGLGAAWWFGVVEIPGLSSAPEPQSLVVPRPTPKPAPPPASTGAGTPDATPAQQGADTGTPAATGTGPAPDHDPVAALRLFENGQDHLEAGRLGDAVQALEQALRLDPMNGEISSLLQKAMAREENIEGHAQERRAAVKSFEGKDFDDALRRFYRLREDQADGPWDTYIANSWFNWGLQLLANGNLREAENKMDEALTVNPEDEEALEIKNLISTYRSRAKDRIFFLRVEALRYRPLES